MSKPESISQLEGVAKTLGLHLKDLNTIIENLKKGEPTQPAPGVFVPESEIEKLRDAVDGGYLLSLPSIIRDFLKAIDIEKGGQTS